MLFTEIVSARMPGYEEHSKFNQIREQESFGKGYPTMDQSHAINLIIEKFPEYKYMAVTDNEKALYSITMQL